MTVTEAVSTTGLPSGEHIPRLGQGTWHMAENPLNRSNEIKALRLGIDLGMSLIDTAEMYADGGANQVLYNLERRGIESDLLPWCQRSGVPVMAYSPIEQGRALRHVALKAIAARLGATPAQVALAWVLRQDGVCAIPQASRSMFARTVVRWTFA
jgi:diketogulonate reductase-like aldo/keto reductase